MGRGQDEGFPVIPAEFPCEVVYYHFSMKTGTNLGRAGSPLPAARPHNDCGAHGVTRPTNVPIPTGNWYQHGRPSKGLLSRITQAQDPQLKIPGLYTCTPIEGGRTGKTKPPKKLGQKDILLPHIGPSPTRSRSNHAECVACGGVKFRCADDATRASPCPDPRKQAWKARAPRC